MNADDLKQILKGYGRKREVIIRLQVDKDHEKNFRLTGDFSANEHPDTFVLLAAVEENVDRGPPLEDVEWKSAAGADENSSKQHSRRFAMKVVLKFFMWYFSFSFFYMLSFFSTLTLIILGLVYEEYLELIFGIILIMLITGTVYHRVFKPAFERFSNLKD
ncbi:MAG: hypothetical protein AAF362_02760 [Pseudomonadota bacterium]